MDQNQNKCPVDHGSNTSAWQSLAPIAAGHSGHNSSNLSVERETSSIPRTDAANWVYPSEAQFFAAMARKQHDPQKADMKTIVPIHNLVNERAWMQVRQWEDGMGGDKCGGIKLVSFQGKPQQLSLRARWNMLLGYAPHSAIYNWSSQIAFQLFGTL
jgi:cytochrome c heme-lyase